jgi:secreted trypsin-like serine protease
MLLPHEMMLSLAIWLVLMAKSTSATILRAKDSSPAMVTTENGETTTTATALLNEIQFPEDNAHGLLRRAQTDTAAGNETTINDGTNIDKIVSGTIVSDLNKYPFIAWPDIRNGGTFCGAILVSPGYLLTAAHCRGAFAGRAVFIGGTNIYGNDARDSVQAVKEIVHPSYNSNNNRYDFMLVRLQRSTTVSPVALNTNSNTPFNSGSAAIVIGYGRTTSTSGLSASLREAQVQTTTSCQNIFNVDLNVHVCAGPTSSTESPCMGDSGG